MNKIFGYFILFGLFFVGAVSLFKPTKTVNFHLESLKQKYMLKPTSSIDHSKLKPLQKDFKSPQEVTLACLSCHTERHKEVMRSSHWNWQRAAYLEGEGLRFLGKKNLLNNFCIGAQSNQQACAKCHIGYGMSDNHFDFKNASNVDCMVCHDNSEAYLKGAAKAGFPDRSVNLKKVAQSVGPPTKTNCGSCHFYSGGGNNVKHGDLEEALLSCDKTVDVHMASNGVDLSCVECHTAENHRMKGKLYSVSSGNVDRARCEDCHDASPHFNNMINRHSAKVSCQACHIPTYAKVNATKMSWKWSEAGKLKKGEPYHQEDPDGNHQYLSTKGKFEWAKNVTPEYTWFNGTASHYMIGDSIKEHPLQINKLQGSWSDPNSKIIPVKIHRGDQIMDSEYKTLIQPKLYSSKKGDSAYWKDFDWHLASAAGMKRIGMPYSGKYQFVETEMTWPLNHMVAPKDQALGCDDCHKRENGRLANLTGFYLPGRDNNPWVDGIGIGFIILSLFGVTIHSIIRFTFFLKSKNQTPSVPPGSPK